MGEILRNASHQTAQMKMKRLEGSHDIKTKKKKKKIIRWADRDIRGLVAALSAWWPGSFRVRFRRRTVRKMYGRSSGPARRTLGTQGTWSDRSGPEHTQEK